MSQIKLPRLANFAMVQILAGPGYEIACGNEIIANHL